MASDKSEELLRDLHGLKDVMVENLDKLLQRDGKIEIIASKAEQLSTSSNTYRKNARRVKNQMRNRRIFLTIMIIVALLVRKYHHLTCFY